MNREKVVQETCRDAKFRIETEFKIDKNYDHENEHEKFRSTTADEKADERSQGRMALSCCHQMGRRR